MAGKGRYTHGLHDLGKHIYAYLQPNGSWGWSNAGLITDSGVSLLVDTLYDLKLTAEMLATMRAATPAASHIEALVNTHGNGDHCYGNQLVQTPRIIASRKTAEQMQELPPEKMYALLQQAPQLGVVGNFLRKAFGAFDFKNIKLTLPKETFEQEQRLTIGNKEVHLLEVGPAHTAGDTLIYVPEDRVIFTGDILFIGGHPIMWAGPTRNWLAACDRILALDVETIVPGHGPLTDKKGVREVKGYLEYVWQEASKRYAAGMPVTEAARDINLNRYASWLDGERIVVNVATIYHELSHRQHPLSVIELVEYMASL